VLSGTRLSRLAEPAGAASRAGLARVREVSPALRQGATRELPSRAGDYARVAGRGLRTAFQGGSIWSYRSRASILSNRSVGSVASSLSFLSAGSLLSVGSVGSILSIGSAGSVLSIGSSGSILSIGAAGGFLTVGGVRRAAEDEAPGEADAPARPRLIS
jgi:hypothetical protein